MIFVKCKKLLFSLIFFLCINLLFGKQSNDSLNIPEWFLNPPKEDNAIYATGYSKKSNQELAVISAADMARAEISKVIRLEINTMTKQYLEDAGINDKSQLTEFSETTSNTMSSNILYSSKIVKQEIKKTDDKYIAYVLIKLDLNEMKDIINGKLSNNIQNEFNELDIKPNKNTEQDLNNLAEKINQKMIKQFNKKSFTQEKNRVEKNLNDLKEEENKFNSGKKPDWIIKYPVSKEYYIGISNGESITQAKDNAINTLVTQIEVTIKSEINDYIKETNDVTEEEISQRLKLNVKQSIEDLELFDTWYNKDEGYWVYYRLNIEKYKQHEQEKIENAKINGLDFLKRCDEESDPALKFKYAFLGYYLTGKYVNRALKVNYKGKEIILVNELTSRMQTILNNFKITVDNEKPEIDKINPVPLSLIFNLSVQNIQAKIFPVKFLNSKGSLIINKTGITDDKGNVNCLISKSLSNELIQSIIIQPDLQAFLKDTAESEEELMVYYNRIIKLGLPSLEILVKVNPPVFNFNLIIENDLSENSKYKDLVKSMSNNFKNGITKKLNAKFTDENSKLKLTMNVSGTISRSDSSGNYFTRLTVSLIIFDTVKNIEIFNKSTPDKGIKGGANDEEKSVRYALDKYINEYNDKMIEDILNIL